MKIGEAIAYLERKGYIRKMKKQTKKTSGLNKTQDQFYNDEEKHEIAKVMKKGKIYGDPMVVLYE